MNLTLSIDETTIERARAVARSQGTSLQELVRAYLRGLAGEDDREAAIARLQEGWLSGPGASAPGYTFRRADAYSERAVLTAVFDGSEAGGAP